MAAQRNYALHFMGVLQSISGKVGKLPVLSLHNYLRTIFWDLTYPFPISPHRCHCLGLDPPHPSLEPPAKLLAGIGGLNLSRLQAMIFQAMIFKTKTKEPKIKFPASQRKLYQFPMACSSVWLTRSSSTSATFHLASCLLPHPPSTTCSLCPSNCEHLTTRSCSVLRVCCLCTSQYFCMSQPIYFAYRIFLLSKPTQMPFSP